MTDLATRRGFDTEVYQPAEDSYLLATACVDAGIPTDSTVVDVGTGSGFVAEMIAKQTGAFVVGVDINPHACRQAKERGIPAVRGDLLSGFTRESVDVIVCNPPYLPTDPEEERSDWLSVALSGGATGRNVVERLLDDLDRVLRPAGSAYLLVSSLMDVSVVRTRARTHGFETNEIARDESFPFEVLSVLELTPL